MKLVDVKVIDFEVCMFCYSNFPKNPIITKSVFSKNLFQSDTIKVLKCKFHAINAFPDFKMHLRNFLNKENALRVGSAHMHTLELPVICQPAIKPFKLISLYSFDDDF